MTVVSSDEASRSMLLPPPPLKREDEEGHGSSTGGGAAGWVVDGRDQENGADLGRVIAVEGLGGLLGQPEVAVVAVELPPQTQMVQESAKPSPRIHEQANCGAGDNGDRKYRVVYKADRRKKCLVSPGGSAGEKIRPCNLAVAFRGQEVGQMAREAATAAIPDGAGPAVDQVLTKMQELLKHGSGGNGNNKVRSLRDTSGAAAVGATGMGVNALGEKKLDVHVVHAAPSHMKQATAISHELKDLHSQEAEAAHGKITSQSDCKIKKEPSKSCMSSIVGSEDGHVSGLSTRLQSLGVTSVTPILSKNASDTVCHPNQSRLLLPRVTVKSSPLLRMLTPLEDDLMHKSSGIPINVLDRYGCSYDMMLKFLPCNNSYRLIGEWRKFLTLSHMISGDLVKLGAFRSEGQLVLTLLHYGNAGKAKEDSNSTVTEQSKEELASRETEESNGELTSRKTEANDEERASRVAEASKEWTCVELEVAGALLMLSRSGDQPKPQ